MSSKAMAAPRGQEARELLVAEVLPQRCDRVVTSSGADGHFGLHDRVGGALEHGSSLVMAGGDERAGNPDEQRDGAVVILGDRVDVQCCEVGVHRRVLIAEARGTGGPRRRLPARPRVDCRPGSLPGWLLRRGRLTRSDRLRRGACPALRGPRRGWMGWRGGALQRGMSAGPRLPRPLGPRRTDRHRVM